MQAPQTITVHEFCISHNIDQSFIHSVSQAGLLQIDSENEQLLIPDDQLSFLEKIVRLHYDLEINIEGIEAIIHLLDRIEYLQREMTMLRNKM